MLLRETGLKVGGSSGATLAACARYLQAHPDLRRIVCICPDDGANYASSIFDDNWLRQQDIRLNEAHLGSVQTISLVGENDDE